GLEVTGVSRLPMKGSPLMGCTTWYVGFSDWMALTVKRGLLVSEAPDSPLGLEHTKLLFISWLAMGA
ncbi:hypothetical protein L9G16_23920, partial [Shewanella sp. A25]|nr:hypothetical protein [Shewanella shenzhenensis]